MRFPLRDKLELPCLFERFVPGRPHPDGRRYLPQIVLRPIANQEPEQITPTGLLLGLLDRHHRASDGDVGQAGAAQLVCALGALRLQELPLRMGLLPEAAWAAGQISTEPLVLGQVVEVATWEEERAHLPYETLYTELLLDIGLGLVGVRTTIAADSIAAAIGKPRLVAGDWVELRQARIDLLAFTRR